MIWHIHTITSVAGTKDWNFNEDRWIMRTSRVGVEATWRQAEGEAGTFIIPWTQIVYVETGTPDRFPLPPHQTNREES